MRKIKFEDEKALVIFQELSTKLETTGLFINEITDIVTNNGIGRTTYFCKYLTRFFNVHFKGYFYRENRKFRCKKKILTNNDPKVLVDMYSVYLDNILTPKPKVNEEVVTSEEPWPILGSQVILMKNNQITRGRIVGMCYFDETREDCKDVIQYTIKIENLAEHVSCFGTDFFKTTQELLNNLIKNYKSKYE